MSFVTIRDGRSNPRPICRTIGHKLPATSDRCSTCGARVLTGDIGTAPLTGNIGGVSVGHMAASWTVNIGTNARLLARSARAASLDEDCPNPPNWQVNIKGARTCLTCMSDRRTACQHMTDSATMHFAAQSKAATRTPAGTPEKHCRRPQTLQPERAPRLQSQHVWGNQPRARRQQGENHPCRGDRGGHREGP